MACKRKTVLGPLTLLSGLILLWLFWPLVATTFLNYWRPRWEASIQTSPVLPGLGQFGDMFGALTSLFTILAFLGVAVTAWLQYRTLNNQQIEINKQQQTNTASLQLSALTAILNSLQDELATATDETEKHFLKLEVARTKGELRELLRAWPQEEMRLSSQFLDDGPVTVDELVNEIIPRFQYISERSIRDAGDALLRRLITRGVNSINRFRQVLRDKDVIEKVELLYVEELKRPPYRLLDPGAIVEWATLLHLKRDNQTLEQLRLALRNCPEANQANQAFKDLPQIPVDGGRKHIKVTEPCVAVINDQDVVRFANFNDLLKWFSENKPAQFKLLVFDRDPGVRHWVEVNAAGEKV